MALVLALVMLVLLGILGTLALSTSSTELRIAGNYRAAQHAFYTADAAVERAGTDGTVRMAIKPTAPVPVFDWNGTYAIGNQGFQAGVNVRWVRHDAQTPVGSGYDAVLGGALSGVEYVVITATGNGPNSALSEIESMVIWVN